MPAGTFQQLQPDAASLAAVASGCRSSAAPQELRRSSGARPEAEEAQARSLREQEESALEDDLFLDGAAQTRLQDSHAGPWKASLISDPRGCAQDPKVLLRLHHHEENQLVFWFLCSFSRAAVLSSAVRNEAMLPDENHRF